MSTLHRLAIESLQESDDCHLPTLAILQAFVEQGVQIQHYLSRACFSQHRGAMVPTGRSTRQLDSWLMSRELCTRLFLHGAQGSSLAIVESAVQGTPVSGQGDHPRPGGDMQSLCKWLDLPRIAVLDLTSLADCQLPARPENIDAIFLNCGASAEHLCSWQTTLEAVWGIPVLGGLEYLSEVRTAYDAWPNDRSLPPEILKALSANLRRYTRIEGLRRLADHRAELPSSMNPENAAPRSTVKVAVAYDDAFYCYYPDVLDALEIRGATIVDFSPLADDCLPNGTDVVYLGCGHPELHAERLASNSCMLAALRHHCCAGGRIYSEGGGMAYLCERLETLQGELVPMAGVFAATARRTGSRQPPAPVELTLCRSNWLAPAGEKLKGYLNAGWVIEPTSPQIGLIAERSQRYALVGQHAALGSLLHVNFAALEQMLGAFCATAAC